jgi:hypothetical protein
MAHNVLQKHAAVLPSLFVIAKTVERQVRIKSVERRAFACYVKLLNYFVAPAKKGQTNV